MINQNILFRNYRLRYLFDFHSESNRFNSPYEYNRFFVSENMSTITTNEFIPMINFRVFKIVDEVVLYPKIKKEVASYKSTIKDFTEKLVTHRAYGYSRVEFKDGDEYRKIYVGYGIILDEDYRILFLAAFRGHLYEKAETASLGEELPVIFTTRDIKIFMSNRFIVDYRRFYNRVKREFLDEYLESGCELSIVNSEIIEDSVYGNEFERVSNFNTVEDKLSFIEEFRNTILEYEQ